MRSFLTENIRKVKKKKSCLKLRRVIENIEFIQIINNIGHNLTAYKMHCVINKIVREEKIRRNMKNCPSK